MELKNIHYNYEITVFINKVIGNSSDATNTDGLLSQMKSIQLKLNDGMRHLSDYSVKCKKEALRDDVVKTIFATYGLLYCLGATLPESEINGVASVDLADITQLTNYERVALGHVKFNMPLLNGVSPVILMYSFLAQKIKELSDHIKQHYLVCKPISRTHVLTEAKKILAYTYYIGYLCGYPVDEDYVEYVRYNMTKFDSTPEDAQLTKEKYQTIGVESEVIVSVVNYRGKESPWYITKSVKDQLDCNGINYPKGEWLDSIKATTPLYRPIENILI